MHIDEDMLQFKCPVCAHTMLVTTEKEDIVKCTDCGFTDNLDKFVEEHADHVQEVFADTISESLEKMCRGSKNLKFKRKR